MLMMVPARAVSHCIAHNCCSVVPPQWGHQTTPLTVGLILNDIVNLSRGWKQLRWRRRGMWNPIDHLIWLTSHTICTTVCSCKSTVAERRIRSSGKLLASSLSYKQMNPTIRGRARETLILFSFFNAKPFAHTQKASWFHLVFKG